MTVFLSILLIASLVLWAIFRDTGTGLLFALAAMIMVAWLLSLPLWSVFLVPIAVVLVLTALLWKQRSGRFWAMTVAGAISALVVLGSFALASGGSSASADGDGGPSQDVINALTVNTANYKCAVDSNGLVAFSVGALQPDRLWSNAVSTPFKATTSPGMVEEINSTVCQDPLAGMMVANYFANLKLGNYEIASLNPWLAEFKGDGATLINVKAASYIGLLNVDYPTVEQVSAAVNKNIDYRVVAEKLNTLLSKFTIGGIGADPSVLNYKVLGGGLVAGDILPAVGLNDKQESLPAIQLVLTQKGQDECLSKIGFNTGDKRLEEFNCELPKCEPGTDKAGQSIPGGEMTTWCNTPRPSESPSPVCTDCDKSTTTATVPSCTDDCLETKVPSKGSGPQGKAGDGGDQNTGLGEFTSTTDTVQPPAAPYVAPVTPEATPAPVVGVPAPSPNSLDIPRVTAPLESAAPRPSEAPSDCVPAPGQDSCP